MKFYSTKETAKLLGVSVRTLQYWRKKEKLIPEVTGAKGAKFYSEVQLSEVQKKLTGAKYLTNKLSGLQNQNMIAKKIISQNRDTIKANFTQNLNALPYEIKNSKRFFPVNANKQPLISGWNNPKNQKHFGDIEDLAGFDIDGHGEGDDYLFFDFDHVLKDGKFVNVEVEDYVNYLQVLFEGIYIEYSISGTGLHALLKPTKGIFRRLAAGDRATYYFYDSDAVRGTQAAKLEIFYRPLNNCFLLTGRKFNDGDKIPQGEDVDKDLKDLLELIKEQTIYTNKKNAV